MNQQSSLPSPPVWKRKWFVASAGLITVLLLCGFGVTGYLRLGADTVALRKTIMDSSRAPWEKKVAVHAGWITLGTIRTATRFFQLPAEPRAVIEAVHAGEFGIYKLQEDPARVDHRALLLAANKTMAERGWDCAVGVSKDGELVGVYVPRVGISSRRLACCVFVLHEENLILISAQGNIQPLLEIASSKMKAMRADLN